VDEEVLETFDLGVISRVSKALLDFSRNEPHDFTAGYEAGTVCAEGSLSYFAVDKSPFGLAWQGRTWAEDVMARRCSSRRDDRGLGSV
jgi:hypothetical protein